MIRDVVVHLTSDQPILVDLLEMPTAVDVELICRNVRTLTGRKPVYVDKIDSIFVFPYSVIRFLEIHATSLDAVTGADEAEAESEPEDLEIDEDFLRRVREA